MFRAFVIKHKSALWTAGAVLLGGSSYYVLHQEEVHAACQAQYNSAFAEQVNIRSRISTASDKAQTDLLSGVGKLILAPPTKDPKELQQRLKKYRSLFVDFNKVVDQVENDRAATPLPETPNC